MLPCFTKPLEIFFFSKKYFLFTSYFTFLRISLLKQVLLKISKSLHLSMSLAAFEK